jgi:dipeptidyl-peptidase 4
MSIMKFKLLKLLIITVTMSAVGQTNKVYTNEDYQRAVDMLSTNVSKYIDNDIRPQWLQDGRLWYESSVDGKDIYKLFDPKDGSFITADSKSDLFKIARINEVEGPKVSRDEVLSPDGKSILFIKDWNLWLRDVESGMEKALTKDGIKDFGYATDNAGWTHSDRPIVSWSPDSKKIATFQQDQRHVKDMYLVKTTVGSPVLEAWKYPLPGDEDIIRIHRIIIDLADNGKIVKLRMNPDARRGTLCDDISCDGGFDDISWSNDGEKLAFVSTSRDHKEAHLRIADTQTGEVDDIFEEIVETQYESGRGTVNWKYLSDSDEIIWYSQRSDWGHLYLYDAKKGKLKNAITKGDFVVYQMLYVDEAERVIYFTAAGKDKKVNPYFRFLYKVNFDGSNLTLLTPGIGNHNIKFSPDYTYFSDSYSQPDVPPVHEARDINGKLIAELERTDLSRLKATGWKPAIPYTVKSADDRWDLFGLMYTPTDLDKTKKYPVIVYIYPGPQGGSVGSWNFRAARNDNQALAELGFIVVQLEGSCNPGRSKSFHDACYGDMSSNTIPDQIAGLRQLKLRNPYMDLDNVGIWGHSGGGFATGSAMFKYPEFFKVGISESGNHDNRNYEDDWGERYNGLETINSEGPTNYDAQANQVYAKDLLGKLLIIHGGMDDNVPPYNSYLVIDALMKANKDFDFILLPNARHGYGADRNYIMRRRWDYFIQYLMKATPPKEFKLDN